MKRLCHLLFLVLMLVSLQACTTFNRVDNTPKNTEQFKLSDKTDRVTYVDKNALAAFEGEYDPVYRLGEGDQLTVSVWNRPELTGKHLVGPDGRITVPIAGTLKVSTMTREEAGHSVSKKLSNFYTNPIVTLGVDTYQSNRIIILGRVLNPGVVQFDRPPTLLEALARSGSLPVLDKQATLTRCAIVRGRDRMLWVDLKRLLNQGDLAYNIRLKPNDLIYIPDSSDTMVYVMGAVQKPGAYRLTPDMSLLDALAQAGGPNEDANTDEVSVYRPSKDAVQTFPMKDLLRNGGRNYSLEEGDVIYLNKTGLADVGYVMKQVLPGLSFLTLGMAAAAFLK